MATLDPKHEIDSLDLHSSTDRVPKSSQVLNHSPSHSLLQKISDSNAVRRLHLGESASPQKFCSNQICTAKYSLLTWAPKSLLLQFKRAANVYFLIISILSFMTFSPKSPVSMVGTFAAVIFFTMLKEGFEDVFRHIQDRATNLEPVSLLDPGTQQFRSVRTQDVKVLDLVRVEDNHQIPADLILLVCANPQGLAFLNTMNLDGETNLKEKTAHENTKKLTEPELCVLEMDVECDIPGPNLHKWNCNVRFSDRDWLPLSTNQLLLRGCVLKNTGYVIGLVAYTGPDTKIMRNSKSAPSKVSHVLRTMNKMLYTIFILQAFICFLYSGLYVNWAEKNAEDHSYLNVDSAGGGSYVIQVLTFYVAYSHLIPISLYVMLEIVKLYLSRLINWDRELYYALDDRPASCRTSDLVEELGQVEFVFSDKTGTLTRNVMEFKKCAVNEVVYDAVAGNGITDVLGSGQGSDLERTALDRFFTQLALCHSVFPTPNPEGGFSYQAASPDELALVQGSARFSYVFCGKEDDRMSLRRGDQNPETWQVIAEIPFDSTRKRMSLLLRDPSGRTVLMCKGADAVMFPLLRQDGKEDKVKSCLDEFAREGLRTLVIAQKYIEEPELTDWVSSWKTVMLSNAGNKDQLIDEQGKAIETGLELVGVTAIEDKLQDGVPETIKLMMEAAIRVWVLTGDKQETAIEIGKSCHLLTPLMQLEDLSSESQKEFLGKLKSCSQKYSLERDFESLETQKRDRNAEGKQVGIVINGSTLVWAMEKESQEDFFKLGFISDSCICCRVSPAQKAEVVKLAKTHGSWVTLSIGDGANDVSMIQEAHIGVGIAGKEGAQAVQASDFAFSQFRFLQRLLLVHGRWNYRRVSWFICYYFYKNVTVVFTELWFAFFNGFSGQIYFADWLPQLYNSFWTSWPCMFTFVYERDLSAEASLDHPIAYIAGQRGIYFTFKRFWLWISLAICHGLICFWVPAQGISDKEKDSGLWFTSTLSFTLIIHVVTYKLFLESIFWTKVNMCVSCSAAGGVSMLFYYLTVIVLNSHSVAITFQPQLNQVFYQLLSNGQVWIVIFITPLVCLLPDFCILAWRARFWQTPVDTILRLEKGRTNRGAPKT